MAAAIEAMVIVGPQGAGKTTAARKAAARHGRYVETTYQELRDPFGLGRALTSQPDVLIVEEMPASPEAWALAKALITERELLVNEKHKVARRVRAPGLFIFTSQHWPPMSPRRLQIIEITADEKGKRA